MQRISIRNRLDDFMMSHGAELAAALAPELMGYHVQHSTVNNASYSIQCCICVKPSWSGWSEGEKNNFSAHDSELLTAAGFRPDAALRADNRKKFTSAQNQNNANKRAELAAR
ncbi:phage polarity suppression protein [Leclercia pneumoniae]|uniref:phage polarity suppression protein n=1 Tax=Leclercia pneumoniae TaxID=2815358 RepID=UPI003BAF290E